MESVATGIFLVSLMPTILSTLKSIYTSGLSTKTSPAAHGVRNTLLIDANGTAMKDDYFKVQQFSTVINKVSPLGFVFDKLLIEDFIPNSSVMLRKQCVDEVSGYDETLFTKDRDLWLRICKRYPIAFLWMDIIHPIEFIHYLSCVAKERW